MKSGKRQGLRMNVFEHPVLGGLFADADVAAIVSPQAQLAGMLRVEAAHARILGSDATADAIAAATIELSVLRDGTAVDGVPVPSLVRALKAQLPQDMHPFVHIGLTSQDVMDTAMVLALRDVLDLFQTRIKDLQFGLDRLVDGFGAHTLMGKTRMQDALPITVADRVMTWALPLADHLVRLDQMRARILRVQSGGPVGLGDNSAMAAAFQLEPSPKAWHAMRDNIAELASWLSIVSGSLGKMGQDLALMAQNRDVVISGGGGSSAMPHKQNPILAELLVTLARFNATQVAGMHHAVIHEQERSGTTWALEWMILPQMLLATGRGLTAAQDIAGKISYMGAPAG